jgi:hypothetical protein
MTSNWFTVERIRWAGGIVAAFLVGFSFGNGHTTQDAIQHVSMQLGDQKKVTAKVVAVAKCEHKRAETAVNVAAQAVAAAETPSVSIPSVEEVPDCPHVKP